ncbi:putative lipoyltransferase 2, mitochondrial [Amphibalanus amphitrite]|uniref:Octanoyl-[acyl-carrier-protein]:protein N-octanoyltransferase LIPT2, mitochondrial n=1 Tax=Amphibalanus amphitrite TaxID=1232801 RepID=A0A6A4XCQ7_AMPAM|nr:putative lipoyltransferase 2, mitochondrial [Amphibalanus amphitrite]
MSRLVRVRHLGLVSYSAGLAAQRAALSAHQAALAAGGPAPHELLLLEHRPVYTVGRRQQGADTAAEEARLRRLGAEFERTGRGGLITFHGPGQLVAYPMLNLRQLGVPGPRRYVCLLEQAIIDVCGRLGVSAATSPHTGVWVGDNKVCALGIHLTQRVLTSHGLALNCSVDLDWFRHIVPCGIADKFVTSLTAELGRPVAVAEAAPLVAEALAARLGCRLVWEDGDRPASDVSAAQPITAE